MTAHEVGLKLADLYRAHDFETIYRDLYSPDIVSIEAGPDFKESVGMDAINAKNEWWMSAMEVHSDSVEGPFPNGDQFALIYEMDLTDKASGNRFMMREVGLYDVENGRIVREKFFYAM